MKSFEELLNQAGKILTEAQIPDARLDAWLLMEYVFGISRAWYYVHSRERANEAKIPEYEALVQRRREHIPLQHLTNQAYFMGREFYVDKRVLIPRQDTEILVEEAGKHLRSGMRILDMCTGSGCILYSLLLMQPESKGTGVDLSADALEVARLNQERLGISPDRAVLINSDLFQELTGSFDMIVSNPPYIPKGDIEDLAQEVREHDPLMALDGGEDGLGFYRQIAQAAPKYLEPSGWIFLEIGWNQGQAVEQLLSEAGFQAVCVKKDYAGLDRVVMGRRSP
ncbi:MAG: peptide chain release factor N(5)-glutamine methyltransferase [Eubacteriales bacterium]|nr:peptide chain release factor N(5)-glutamine methyltransferase [Eubacteriales bacterium]